MEFAGLSKRDMELVEGCFLFDGLEEAVILRTLGDKGCLMESYRRGDVIYDESHYRRNIGMILEGTVEVRKGSPDGGRYVMNTLSDGGVFGVAAMFNDRDCYVTSLVARDACRVVFLDQPLLERLMREDFRAAENYIEFLSGRICFLNEKISGLLISGTDSTLRHWLARNLREEDGRYYVKLDVSISALASMLHMGRASLYRSLCELEREGLIKKDGRCIEILRPENLIPGKEQVI